MEACLLGIAKDQQSAAESSREQPLSRSEGGVVGESGRRGGLGGRVSVTDQRCARLAAAPLASRSTALLQLERACLELPRAASL